MMNNKGFSLPEILIGAGIMGAVALGSVYLFKNQQDLKKSVDSHADTQLIQKMVESKLYTEEGCNSLKGLTTGQNISLNIGKDTYAVGSRVGKNKIESFKVDEFIPYDEEGASGVAKVTLSLKKEDGKNAIIQLPVAVNMNGSAIESCNTSLQKITDDLFQNICGGSFGTLSKGKTCSQVLSEVQNLAIKSICDDVFGTESSLKGEHCDLKLVHANKLCGDGQAAKGFDAQGKLQCGALPVVKNAPPVVTPPATPPPVLGCSAWGPWTPGTENTCSSENLTQSRSCVNGSGSETRTVQGTKDCYIEWGLCFIAGTKVTLPDGNNKNIEDLVVGEKVLTYDEVTRTQVSRSIKKVFHHEESVSPLFTLTFLNGKNATSNDVHPYYIPDWGRYASAEEIFEQFKIDPLIHVLDVKGANVLITKVEKTFEKIKLYNIHVNGIYDTKDHESDINHNYYANDVLVHNMKAYPDCRQTASEACGEVTGFQWGTPVKCKGTEEQKKESLRILERCKDSGGKP